MPTAVLVSLLLALTLLLGGCTGAGELASDSGSRTSAPESTASSDRSAGPTEPTEGSGPTDSPSEAETATPSASPPEPPPPVGVCRRLRIDDLNSVVNDGAVVPCRDPHTSVTYFVGELSPGVFAGVDSPGDDRVEEAADRRCTREFRTYVGGSRADRALTSLRVTYFLPDAEQFEAGARWVRCDIFAYGDDDTLAHLPGRLQGALENPAVRARVGTCARVGPDRPSFQHIICQRPHRWRAVGVVRLGAPDTAFPGPRRLGQLASDRCEGVVRNYLDTRDAFAYGYEVPRASSWQAGDRFGYCWAQTSR